MKKRRIQQTLTVAGLSLTFIGSASAALTLHGSATAYTEAGNDWLSMGANDIDTSGGLGTDGFIMAGLYDGTSTNNDSRFTTTSSLPSYVSNVTGGSNVIGTTYGNPAYGNIDNPLLLDGTDQKAGFWIATGGNAGDSREIIKFDVAALEIGQTVRIGIFAGMQQTTDGRWDPTSITLTDGSATATVGNHGTNNLTQQPGGSHTGNGWVFFDIDAGGSSYTVTATKRLTGQGASLSGLTFDSITIPEPSTGLLGLLGALMLGTRRRR